MTEMTSIAIGWVDNGNVRGEFTESITQLTAYETVRGRFATTVRIRSGPQMPEGRNHLVERFLTTPAEWLFMVDTDMKFTHDSAERLLQTAEAENVDVVGGLCFGANKEFGQFPTMYTLVDGLPVVMLDYPRDRVVGVSATGAAFVLTRRNVFEENRREGEHTWFHRHEIEPTDNGHPGGVLGEDLSWHMWLSANHVPIVVDTRIKAGHVKPSIMSEDSYLHPSDQMRLVDSDIRV